MERARCGDTFPATGSLVFNPNSDVGGDEMAQDAEPRCLEEG